MITKNGSSHCGHQGDVALREIGWRRGRGVMDLCVCRYCAGVFNANSYNMTSRKIASVCFGGIDI